MRWEDLKSPQLDAMSRDTLVVLPVAAIEQHSVHLPVSTDTAIANGLVQRLDAARDNKLLVLPTFWLGCSKHHMDFCGTLTAELDHWSACVMDILNSVIHHGFKKIMVLNCHGGNHTIMAATLEKMKYSQPDALIVGATYWHIASEALTDVRESDFGGMGHACEMETSMMLVLKGELVDMSLAQSDRKPTASKFTQAEMLQGAKAVVVRTFKQMTHRGGMGDAQIATAEKGERFFDAVIGSLSELIDDIEADRLLA